MISNKYGSMERYLLQTVRQCSYPREGQLRSPTRCECYFRTGHAALCWARRPQSLQTGISRVGVMAESYQALYAGAERKRHRTTFRPRSPFGSSPQGARTLSHKAKGWVGSRLLTSPVRRVRDLAQSSSRFENLRDGWSKSSSRSGTWLFDSVVFYP